MRVAYFTDTDRLGGAERVLVDMVAGTVSAGHEAVLMCPEQWLLDHVIDQVPGVRTRLTADASFRAEPTLARRGRAVVRQVPALVAALRAIRPDVLHVSNGGYPGSELCRLVLLAACVTGVQRRVLSVHAVPRPREEGPPGQAVIDAAVWRCVDVVVGGSRAVADGLEQLRGMPPRVFRLLPYGVRRPISGSGGADSLRARLRLSTDDLLVGMVSAASDPQKGHSVFVAAVASTPGAHGVIIGAAPPEDVLAAVADQSSRITVLGRMAQLGDAYEALDALVVPSVSDESMPLVVLEAMACGRPVLASRLSGIPEVVRDGVTGALFSPGSSAELSSLMLGRRDRFPAWGAAGRDRWAERFSVDAMTRSILSLYDE